MPKYRIKLIQAKTIGYVEQLTNEWIEKNEDNNFFRIKTIDFISSEMYYVCKIFYQC